MLIHIPFFNVIRIFLVGSGCFLFAGRYAVADSENHGLGGRRPTAADVARDEENLIMVDKVYLNRLGLDRVNQERVAKGQQALGLDEVDLAEGEAMVSGKSRKGHRALQASFHRASRVQSPPSAPGATSSIAGVAQSGTGVLETGAVLMNSAVILPGNVDNSTNIWFPPIGNQGSLNSCVAWASVYYSTTYAVARANHWNVTSGSTNQLFSPRFIYNLINGGVDNGTWISRAYSTLEDHGAPFLSDLPYTGDYKSVPQTAALWREALHYRMGAQGAIAGIDTPGGLQNLKTMLANGCIVNMSLDIYAWHFTTLKYNPCPGADNAHVGWPVVDYAANNNPSGHCMTVVGYDDNAWCDINGNGVIDPGEIGALKVCNSWGTTWKQQGFAYVSYDALKKTSAIAGAHNINREAAFWDQSVYWIQARPAGYTPTLLGQATLATADRANTIIQLGATSTTAPTVTWQPSGFQNSGNLGFAGTSSTSSAVCVFDFTDIAAGNASLNWYLMVTNSANAAKLSSFTLTDGSGNQLATCAGTEPSGGLPQTATSSNSVYAWTAATVIDSGTSSAVTDLSVAGATANQVDLSWTQPGNDGMNGMAASYSLRCSGSAITSDNFSSATLCPGSITPGEPGSTGTTTVPGLTPGNTYYFALETINWGGHVSPLSNVVSVTLPASLAITTQDPLPTSVVNKTYSTQFQATGGTPPYNWSNPPFVYADTSGTAALTTGSGFGCHGVDPSVDYSFPAGFSFPIGGGTANNAWVSSAGYIWIPSNGGWNFLAPFNAGLSTSGSGEDVFVSNYSDHLVFRWIAHPSNLAGVNGTVNFEVVFYQTGRIEFIYGSIAGSTTRASIYMNLADGEKFTSVYNNATTVPAGTISSLAPYTQVPGLNLDPSTGILSGIPTTSSTYSIPVIVTDSSGIQQTISQSFGLTVALTGQAIIPGLTAVQVPMGGYFNLPVTLAQDPGGSVTVNTVLASGDTNIRVTGGGSLQFDRTNWNTPQSVTLSAAANVPNGQAVITLSASGLASVPIIATETDQLPTLINGPTATPSLVTGTQTILNALGADNNGESGLTYTWSTLGTPPAAVKFILNNTHEASTTPAFFGKAGTYALGVTVTDASGGSVSGSTSVTVSRTLTSVAVSPTSVIVTAGTTQQFTATAKDQFGTAMSPTPSITWSVTGGGTINSTGLLSAGLTSGSFNVIATTSGVSGSASCPIFRPLPGVMITSPSTPAVIVPNAANSLVLTSTATSLYTVPTLNWSQVSGPVGQSAVFANPSLANTSVSFPTSGTYTLCCSANDGVNIGKQNLLVGVGVTDLTPYPLINSDIGTTGASGSATVTSGTYTVIGSGADIGSNIDALNYDYVQTPGDMNLTARVSNVQNTNATAKAGVMIRQSTAAGAANALVAVTPGSGVTFQCRTALSATTSSFIQSGITAPCWVRLVRAGNSISGYYSSDGAKWSQLGTTQTIVMTSPVLSGLCVTSHLRGTLCTATFDNLTGLPAMNAAPQVNPGVSISSPVNVPSNIPGTASDDGLPMGSSLISTWSFVSGSSTATFGNPNAPSTTVSLSNVSQDLLRLTASDGVATVFQNLGVTAYIPPTISSFANQQIVANANSGPLSFAIGNAVVPIGSFFLPYSSPVITGSSSNQTLVPNANIVFGNDVVTITPAPNQTGSSTITVTANCGTPFPVSSSFVLTVISPFVAWIDTTTGLGALTGPLDDPKQDGIPNVLNYAFGVASMTAGNWALPVVSLQNGCLTLTYRQNKSATDLSFVVEGSDNLSSAQWSAAGITVVNQQDQGDYWLVTARDSVPIVSGSSRFIHLKVIQPVGAN